jgi:hypothetical protein
LILQHPPCSEKSLPLLYQNDLKSYIHHHHHHHTSVMELGHLLTRSGLTYPEVSSKIYHDSFCQSYILPSLNNTCIHVPLAPSLLSSTVNQSMRLVHFSISSPEFSGVL